MLNLTEAFGSWILDTNKGLFFGLGVLILTAWIAWKTFVGSVVILSEKEFECVLPAPDGLGTKCIEYHAKRLK